LPRPTAAHTLTAKSASLIAGVLLSLVGPATSAAAAAAPEQQDAVRSGEEIYLASCSVCHGQTGAGDGVIKFDPPARSFKKGGFSFGNTPEALFRTVSSGIGGTPMPGFEALLSEAERRAVVEYVIKLGPEPQPKVGNSSVLSVGDRPVVVRGQLSPILAGAPELPRGLMIGTIDGLSWQYRADDLRLLAVRQGPFVNRKDWGGRGGGPVEPLGKVVHLMKGGEPPATFLMKNNLGGKPDRGGKKRASIDLRYQLTSTRIADGKAVIHGKLVAGELSAVATAKNDQYPAPQSGKPGLAVAKVSEWGEAVSLQNASGFRRHISLRPGDGKARPDLLLALNLPAKFDGPSELVSNHGSTWVWYPWKNHAIAYGFQIEGISFAMMTSGRDTRLMLPAGTGELKVQLTTLLLPNADVETWKKLQEEVQ
jgi:mono/diheme cytochrome c family protein